MLRIPLPLKENTVLSLQGGGIKGLVILRILVEIEKITEQPISHLFNIISGTSVGGLIAALLTIPKEKGSSEPKYSAQDALDIFIKTAPEIFPHIFLGSVKQIFTHKYDEKPLEEILEKYLEDNRMDSPLSRLIIPVADLNAKSEGLEIFDSHDSYSPHVRVKDVVRATSAAPTYFKPVLTEGIKGHDYASGTLPNYADGGLGANRPAYEVLKVLKDGHTRDQQNEILDQTMICSINFKSEDEENSIPTGCFDGLLGWLVKGGIVNKIMKTSEYSSTDEVRLDLCEEGEFNEIALSIPKECMALDNAAPENMAKLIKIGEEYINNNRESLQKLCVQLVENAAAFKNRENIDEGFVEDDVAPSIIEKILSGNINNSEDEGFCEELPDEEHNPNNVLQIEGEDPVSVDCPG